ncbi:MAG: metal-dependent transcriptional regulator [Clostridia bacterium]|nr:metal-dependent transcriptional regulator [Clostridia bacterium]
MYLEDILVLRQRLGGVRAIDVVKLTGYSKPSVSRALANLREGKMILVDSDGYITLTPEGEARAQKVYERHRTLTEFFRRIGVPDELASADACKIEHDISDETFLRIQEHLLSLGEESR